MPIGGRNMAFPSEKELKKIRSKLGKAQGFLMLDPKADQLAKFRFEICQGLLKYARDKKLTAIEMAKLLGITKADMSRIFNHRIDRFSTDKLIRLYAKVRPNYRLEVA